MILGVRERLAEGMREGMEILESWRKRGRCLVSLIYGSWLGQLGLGLGREGLVILEGENGILWRDRGRYHQNWTLLGLEKGIDIWLF